MAPLRSFTVIYKIIIGETQSKFIYIVSMYILAGPSALALFEIPTVQEITALVQSLF